MEAIEISKNQSLEKLIFALGIPNVGEKRRRALLMKFGSVDNIKKATVEELLETPSIDKKSAESIFIYFNGNN